MYYLISYNFNLKFNLNNTRRYILQSVLAIFKIIFLTPFSCLFKRAFYLFFNLILKMKNLFYLLLIVVLHLIFINCEEKPDLDIVLSIDDGKSSIEVYKAKENDLILKSNNASHDFKKLNWYSIGTPVVIKRISN